MAAKGTSSVSGFARSTFSTVVEKGRYDGDCPFSNEVGEGAPTGRMRSLWRPYAIALNLLGELREAVRGPYSGNTLPGFKIPFGSKASFILRMT